MSGGSDRSHSHSRAKPAGGPNDGGFDWFNVLDVAVWASVAVIAVIGIEWLAGRVLRERIAAGAEKYIHKQADNNAS